MIPQLAVAGVAPSVGTSAFRRSPAPRTKAAARPRAKKTRAAAAPKDEAAALKTSEILRNLLDNKDRSFTIQKISEALGTSSFGTSILVFSIPEVVPIPVPGLAAVVALPTGLISAQMVAGCKEIKLPKWILKRSVPRKVLAAAIHSILPVLEKAEKAVRPRGRWVSHPLVKRLLGVFIFLLAVTMMLPIPFTNMPPAIAMFVTSLGLIEKDGLMIALGILIGLLSMALVGAIAFGVVSLFGL